MSTSKVVVYRERGFWAYDIVLGVFVKYLIDEIEATGQAHTPFLAEAIPVWRLAVLYDSALTLKESWTPLQRQNVIEFAEQACARLATRESISTEEIVSWPFAGEEHIFPLETDTYGIARLQKSHTAISSLARGTAQSTVIHFSFPILLKKRRSASGLVKRY